MIYNAEVCYFLYAQDALSILYFLRPLEETLLRQTHIVFDQDMHQPNEPA